MSRAAPGIRDDNKNILYIYPPKTPVMKYLLILPALFLLIACNTSVRQKTKDAVNKTGEVVAEAGSEFVDGVSKGIRNSFSNELVFSEDLRKAGVKAGRVSITSSDSATDNVLRVYLIFDQPVSRNIMVKVFDENGQEYGRAVQAVQAQKDEAKYIDFVFDRRTNIDGKGKITFE